MNAFELFFNLFGLILGLAVAKVISGLSDVLRERDPVRVGWLSKRPALAFTPSLQGVEAGPTVIFPRRSLPHDPIAPQSDL